MIGIDLQGDRLDPIDEPERPLHPSAISPGSQTRWDAATNCSAKSTRGYQRLEEKEAQRKARNRKKAEAKKVVNQRRKAVKAGRTEGRAEGDDNGRLHDLLGQVQPAEEAEEKEGGAQASKDAKGA